MLIDFDSSNSDHVKALEYFKVAGHPKCKSLLNDDIDDIDLLLRDVAVRLFEIESDYLDDPNGSVIKVSNDDPSNFEIYANFVWDDCEEFVNVKGKLKIFANEAVFIFDPIDMGIISENEFNRI